MSLFSPAEARAYRGGVLASEAKYPDADITAAAARILALFERTIGVRLESTTATNETHDGDGSQQLIVDHLPVIAVSAAAYRTAGTSTWTAFTADELADIYARAGGRLYRESLGTWPSGVQNVRVTYTHGVTDADTAAEAKSAGLMLITDPAGGLISTDMPMRAMSLSDEFGTFRLATPGIGSSITGIPEVDVVLNQMRDLWFRPVVG